MEDIIDEDWRTYQIYPADLLEVPHFINCAEQSMLQILKTKGAPVLGTFHLIADYEYDWKRYDLPNGIIQISVRKREKM